MTIELDPSWISDVSMDAYSVDDDTGTITETRYARFLTMVEPRLLVDGLIDSDGSLISGAEYLAALLICDLIANGSVKDFGVISENFNGDYSYTKSAVTARTTNTNFLVRYEEELAKRTIKQPSSGSVREDFQIEFSKLTQGNIPKVTDSSGDYNL